jgi:hypothetical protein
LKLINFDKPDDGYVPPFNPLLGIYALEMELRLFFDDLINN